MRKENAKEMSYVEQTFRPRNLVDLEKVLVITYGQPTKLEAIYTKQLKIIGRCPWPIRAENAQSIYQLLHTALSVVLSAESCVAYFRQTQGPDKAEKTLSQGLHTNCFLSALINVLDPEMTAILAPKLDSQAIPFKFDAVADGVRQRLKVADVMVNQLQISSSTNNNQRVMLAVSNQPDEAGSSNDQQNGNQFAQLCVAIEGVSSK